MKKLEINLDDEEECKQFLKDHATTKGRRLANKLGLKGIGSVNLADWLSCYAWNRITAFELRRQGKIVVAMEYEAICERIYSKIPKSLRPW